MSAVSRKLVLKKRAIVFPDPSVAKQALRSLARYGKSSSEPLVDAVHLAIIKLSDGELWKLRELVRAARGDFRDVLYPAQAPERFKDLRDNPPPDWGKLPRPKALSAAKQTAMDKRDLKQWLDWLAS